MQSVEACVLYKTQKVLHWRGQNVFQLSVADVFSDLCNLLTVIMVTHLVPVCEL